MNVIQPTIKTLFVALHLLNQSKRNVRKTNVDKGIAELASSIEAHGLLQNLTITSGNEVIAGQRRLKALQLLAKEKKIPAGFQVPCFLVEDEGTAEALSLAENAMREAMHPADQFEAFAALVAKGMPIEDVAAQYGVTPAVVKGRMKLAAVSPKLLKLFRAGEMTLEQIMAFTLSDDHKKQEKVWKEAKDWERDAYSIRRALTGSMASVRGSAIAFIGMEAYEAAGGKVLRDLFDEKNSGYIENPEIVEKLVESKLNSEVAKLLAEGWSWAETTESINSWYSMVKPVSGDDPEEYDDDEEDDDGNPIVRVPAVYAPEDMARSGALVGLSYSGALVIRRGVLNSRKDEEANEKNESTEKEQKPKPEFSFGQVEELTAQRTAALRLALMNDTVLAAKCLVHRLAMRHFHWGHGHDSCLDVSMSSASTDVPTPTECPAQAKLDTMKTDWEKKVPKDESKLWAWVLKQTPDAIDELLTYLTAVSLDAIERKHGTSGAPTDATHADLVAKELNFDMADHWQPTAEGFIGRMKKGQMVKALKDVNLPDVAANVNVMKRDAAVKATATALTGKRWLPTFLRPANDKKKGAAA
jgi:ParB family chromosome partitioning protein